MCRRFSRAVGVLAALALGAGLAACAGSGASLPECKGRAVPINVRAQVNTAAGAAEQPSDAP